MRPSYYADLYRRFQTYVRNYDPEKPIFKVCGGANVDDYHWTKTVLDVTHDHTLPQFHGFMDGLSLHYYVHPEGWEIKGSATEFDEAVWYKTLSKALYMDKLVKGHSAIMDQYDPEKKIGMIVDEWGTWYTCEPGTNPGFLYQQNTVRDALVAGITLDIFNQHSDRVRMANLAQMVNVLQAVILTEGEKMIKTPTYHVMHMYRYHQDADLVESVLTGSDDIGPDEWRVPELSQSVSVDKDGVLTVTISNLSATDKKELDICRAEGSFKVSEAKIVGGDMHDHNTFASPECVCEKDFSDYDETDKKLSLRIPAASVVMLRLTI